MYYECFHGKSTYSLLKVTSVNLLQEKRTLTSGNQAMKNLEDPFSHHVCISVSDIMSDMKYI